MLIFGNSDLGGSSSIRKENLIEFLSCATVQVVVKAKEIVVDASVVIAVILNEPEKRRIIEITQGRELVSPGCLKWEVGNAFSAMLKRKRLEENQVQIALDTFSMIPIKEMELNFHDALRLCSVYKIYAYDAYYLMVAKHLSRPMLSLDDRMMAVAREEGINLEEV